jgi:KUP system potassium uptake protein
VISGAFSVTQQLVQLGYLPRMSIRHTSERIAGQIYIPMVNWFLLAAVIALVFAFRNPAGLASAYGVALSAIFATNTLLAFTIFRVMWRKPLWIVIPGAVLFISIELTFFAANLGKLFSGGWLPLAIGAGTFTVLTTWKRGTSIVARRMREGRVPLRRYLNRLIDDPPTRVPGSAVFLSTTRDAVPPALLNNVHANRVVHQQVILLTVETAGVPHLPVDARISIDRMRLGFVGIVARFGYQDQPDVIAALGLAQEGGLDIDLDHTSFYVSRVSVIPTGRSPMRRWRKWLFIFLHRNATPSTRYFRIPPDRVVEVGAQIAI